jgi:outer membrane lipoprotein-sorting protein
MRRHAFNDAYRLPLAGLGAIAVMLALALAEAKAPAAVHGVSRAPMPFSAQEIVARNVAARGGLDGWRKLKTMVWLGHIESERAPAPSMGFVLEQARPNKMRFQLIAAKTHSIRVFDGTQGWKVRPVQDGRAGVQPYTPEELRFARSAPGLDGPLIDLAAKGSSVALDGTEDIDGHKTYRLNVTLSSGERDQVWVDAGSFLDVRYDRPATSADGTTHTVTVYYLEYKKIEGLSIPSLIVTRSAPGSRPDRMVVERIALNAPLEEGIFANPAKEHLQTRAAGATRPLSD